MSEKLLSCLQASGLAAALPENEANKVAAELDEITGQQVYSRSITAADKAVFFLARDGETKSLGVISAEAGLHRKFIGSIAEVVLGKQTLLLTLAETSSANAASVSEPLAPNSSANRRPTCWSRPKRASKTRKVARK